MGRKPKPPASIFDLGFPIHSRVAADQIDSMIGERLSNHQDRVARSHAYLAREMELLANSHMDRFARVMDPFQPELDQIIGRQNVRQIGVQSAIDRDLMEILNRYNFTDGKPGAFVVPAERPPPLSLNPVNGQMKPLPKPGPFGTKPFPVPAPAPAPIPCPNCGFTVFVFNCPPPVINLSCPECHCEATCQVDVQYISTVVIQIINKIMQQANCVVQVSPQTIVNIVNDVIVKLPPPPPPPPPPDQEKLGRDCKHAIHIALCGQDETPLGSDCDHPLFFVQCVPKTPCPRCPL